MSERKAFERGVVNIKVEPLTDPEGRPPCSCHLEPVTFVNPYPDRPAPSKNYVI